jgi:hypothetical protein
MKLPSGTTARFEFNLSQKREMAARSGGICEAGKSDVPHFYGMAKGDECKRAAKEFDHVVADGLKRERPRSSDDGLHVCLVHHKIKTHTNDRPKIQKAKRIREAEMGVVKPKVKFQSRGFNQPYVDNTKYIERDFDT